MQTLLVDVIRTILCLAVSSVVTSHSVNLFVSFLFCFCFMCVLRGDIPGPFYSQREGAQFYHYYINGLGETLSCNRPRQIGCNRLRQALNEVPCLQHCLWIPNNGFHIGVPVLFMVYCLLQRCWSFNQYNLQDRMLRLNSNPTLF